MFSASNRYNIGLPFFITLFQHMLIILVFAGIAWQKKSHRDFFKDQDVYEEFHRLIARAINISNWAAARIVQGKIVEWLRSEDETEAADWFEKYWC